MGALSYLRQIYDLDTLDTRFTNTSTTPYKTVIESRNDPDAGRERAAKFGGRVQPSRWKTPEFIFYLLFLLWVLPTMFYVAYQASQSKIR